MNGAPSVLIVDDERVNVDLLVGLLKPHYRTLVATNGDQALKRAAGEPRPDILLLDVMMPGMDGYEVCRRLKADPRTSDIPVIFVTAMNDVGDETRGFGLGAVDYITKPVSPPIVEARLRAHLENRQARALIEDRNRVLEGMVQERTRDLARLLEVSAAMTTELQLHPLLRMIMGTVAMILEADRATLFLHDTRTRELWALVEDDEVRFPRHLGIAGIAFTTGEALNIPDASADPRVNREIDKQTGYKTDSILCMPVINRNGKTIAVTQVLNKRGGPFTEVDEKRLRAFSSQAAIAMENAQLFAEVTRIMDYNEAILQSMSNGVVTLDATGHVVKVNAAAGRLLQAEPDALAGQKLPALLAEENAWVAEAVASVEKTNQPRVVMDASLALEGNGSASVNLSAVPLRDEGVHVGCMLMIEDITREKRLKGTMARYMSPELAEKLLAEGEAALGGKVQHASVLFTDIRNFTSISERIGAQETVKLLNEYLGIMVDVILEKGGMLDKYIGDAIMAVFGAPFPHPEDADHAVEAAIGMLRELAEFNARRMAEGREPVLMGLGINTDDVLSGNIGSLKRMDYTVIGDGVNLASRLEGANKVYGTEILISEFTARELKGRYRLREVDVIQVVGKTQPVGVLEVLDHLEASEPRLGDLLDAHAKGLALYRSRDWARARAAFEEALAVRPQDGPARIYRDRCGYFLEHPPAPGWDGVWTMQRK